MRDGPQTNASTESHASMARGERRKNNTNTNTGVALPRGPRRRAGGAGREAAAAARRRARGARRARFGAERRRRRAPPPLRARRGLPRPQASSRRSERAREITQQYNGVKVDEDVERGAARRWRRGGRTKLDVTNRVEMARAESEEDTQTKARRKNTPRRSPRPTRPSPRPRAPRRRTSTSAAWRRGASPPRTAGTLC